MRSSFCERVVLLLVSDTVAVLCESSFKSDFWKMSLSRNWLFVSKRLIPMQTSLRLDGVLRGGEMRNVDNVHISSFSMRQIDWWCWWPGIEYRGTFVGTITSPILVLLLCRRIQKQLLRYANTLLYLCMERLLLRQCGQIRVDICVNRRRLTKRRNNKSPIHKSRALVQFQHHALIACDKQLLSFAWFPRSASIAIHPNAYNVRQTW